AFIRAANHEAENGAENPTFVPVAELTQSNPPAVDDNTLISWMSDSVPIRITPVDTQPLFSAEKTYWLVGLTGGLGLSLCEWMVGNGARHVVLSSRNPKVERRWEDYIRQQGAVVRLYANDITDLDSVRSTYETICRELPPIGGVAQGAM